MTITRLTTVHDYDTFFLHFAVYFIPFSAANYPFHAKLLGCMYVTEEFPITYILSGTSWEQILKPFQIILAMIYSFATRIYLWVNRNHLLKSNSVVLQRRLIGSIHILDRSWLEQQSEMQRWQLRVPKPCWVGELENWSFRKDYKNVLNIWKVNR